MQWFIVFVNTRLIAHPDIVDIIDLEKCDEDLENWRHVARVGKNLRKSPEKFLKQRQDRHPQLH